MNKKEFNITEWLNKKPDTTNQKNTDQEKSAQIREIRGDKNMISVNSCQFVDQGESVSPSSVDCCPLSVDLQEEIELLTVEIENRAIDIAPDYQSWRDLGFALADALGENGRNYYHRISRFYPNYSYEETDKQFTACLKGHGHGITSKTIFHLAKQAGITITPISPITPFKTTLKTSIPSNDVFDVFDEGNKITLEKMPNFYSLVKDNLPDFLKKIADTTITDEDADIMILGSIITISACLPNLSGIYAGREVFPNLFLFVTAQASAGKGKLSLCRKLVEPIHRRLREEYDTEMEIYRQQLTEYAINKKEPGVVPPKEPPHKMLFIPANSSSTAVYQALNENRGIGLIFETEGDTLANTFKSDYGNFSDGFRKAFQHEPISYLRRKDRELVELDKPRLSALLSGTPRQVLSLIPDAENGLFSRFIFYYLTLRLEWLDVSLIKEPLDRQFETFGKEFDTLNQYLKSSPLPIRFDFTAAQFKDFNAKFKQIQNEYLYVFGSDIVSSIRRLGIVTFRIAMTLSALRILENGLATNVITCTDTDYTTAMTMINVLLKHTAKVFQMMPENNTAVMHGSRNQLKQQFFDALPHDFDTQYAISVAQSLNIAKPTAERYLKQWCLSAQLNHVSHGRYSKW